jgi:plasmid stabilization system protein ParE
MTRPIVFLPEARAEFDDDANWYENRQAGLGKKFTLAVNRELDRIAKNPRMHAAVLEDLRKAVVSGFPYCVYYRDAADKLVVLSVFHTSRDPNDWQKRA